MVPQGKNKAVIAYLTLIGFFIAVSMNKDEKHEFATWHIKNMFGLLLLLFVSLVFQYQISLLFGDILWGISALSWLFSLIMAITNKKIGLPYLSEKFQDWFTFLD
ncbi:hypothetical protein [Patiriisocius hiemis]|uniref:Uncharacterized protein n=1 Tax=Patiriisocius hiemis TaxID=3075604 RepID=A0ABU2Y9R3_9FLAO|nr:hypothetical protein [Constantimarinum sp. W242]MDT0554930.1 hypothetical protein [Constantimarinum sp. W242]